MARTPVFAIDPSATLTPPQRRFIKSLNTLLAHYTPTEEEMKIAVRAVMQHRSDEYGAMGTQEKDRTINAVLHAPQQGEGSNINELREFCKAAATRQSFQNRIIERIETQRVNFTDQLYAEVDLKKVATLLTPTLTKQAIGLSVEAGLELIRDAIRKNIGEGTKEIIALIKKIEAEPYFTLLNPVIIEYPFSRLSTEKQTVTLLDETPKTMESENSGIVKQAISWALQDLECKPTTPEIKTRMTLDWDAAHFSKQELELAAPIIYKGLNPPPGLEPTKPEKSPKPAAPNASKTKPDRSNTPVKPAQRSEMSRGQFPPTAKGLLKKYNPDAMVAETIVAQEIASLQRGLDANNENEVKAAKLLTSDTTIDMLLKGLANPTGNYRALASVKENGDFAKLLQNDSALAERLAAISPPPALLLAAALGKRELLPQLVTTYERLIIRRGNDSRADTSDLQQQINGAASDVVSSLQSARHR